MRALSLLALLFTLSLLTTPAAANDFKGPTTDVAMIETGDYILDKSHANIVFRISHLGFSQYIGRFNSFDGTLNFTPSDVSKSKVSITIDPNSIDTNHEELEGKLKSDLFFNTAVHPTITFQSTTIKKTSANKGEITGNLTLMGVTKPVTLATTFNGGMMHPYAKKFVVGFSATARLKRSDFGMKGYLPAIGDDVDLLIEVEFQKQ
jgi:polyisoprenoid-binding protein YceI